MSTIGLIDRLLVKRDWMLDDPSAEVSDVQLGDGASFKIIRDDLKHPYIGGNKRRKLDGIWPEIVERGVRDVITCGGTQSAHVVAVASVAAEAGIRAHILFRGERPPAPTGNHLLARMLAHNVVYVPREEYADRLGMLSKYEASLRELMGETDAQRVAVIPEGASEPAALLGMARMIHWMAESGTIGLEPAILVVDCGTGTSCVGLALGAALLGLPWNVVGVMLAGSLEYYEQQVLHLVGEFCRKEGLENVDQLVREVNCRLSWTPRRDPRRFGKVRPAEVTRCSEIASKHGIVLDPLWTLAAWDAAEQICAECSSSMADNESRPGIVMIHTGGIFGLFGLAQRFPDEF